MADWEGLHIGKLGGWGLENWLGGGFGMDERPEREKSRLKGGCSQKWLPHGPLADARGSVAGAHSEMIALNQDGSIFHNCYRLATYSPKTALRRSDISPTVA